MRRRKRRRGASKPARAARHSWLQPLKARPPAPFFDSGERPVVAGPETALLCAVLEDAFACIYEAKDPELAADAERWFFRDRSRTVFSFLSLCEALDLDPGEIRSRLAEGMKMRVAAAPKKKAKHPARRAPASPPKWLGGGAPRLTRK
jgi:hypothetical protein